MMSPLLFHAYFSSLMFSFFLSLISLRLITNSPVGKRQCDLLTIEILGLKLNIPNKKLKIAFAD